MRLAPAGGNTTGRRTGRARAPLLLPATVALALISVAATGCPDDGGTGLGEAIPPAAPPTTAAPPNRPPEVRADSFATTVGERLEGRLSVGDPDGRVTGIAWRRPPPGFESPGGADDSFSWTPPVAGTWQAQVTATDDDGASTTAEITFMARHPHRRNVLVALGDSVAAGFGLDLSDALLGDPCWRAPEEGYPERVMDRLVAEGLVPVASEARVVLAACAGSSTVDVWATPTQRPPGAPEGFGEPGWSQLDWAVGLNPRFVTLTVGANDVGVVDLAIIEDGELDRAELDRRIEAVAGGVGYLLDALVAQTDSRIVLTSYYNPTATDPTGLAGCRGACFVEKAALVHEALNGALARAAARHGPRVQMADIASLFRGREAGDSLGPSWLRDPIEAFLGVRVGAYCSKDDPSGSWISSFDCIHPTGDGMAAIAGAVAAAFAAPRDS
ncbi:MAG: GDSL-type esterase/lipase family protein [bacterium]|nr:GDSL-type esterase/lipase family protein [bacterium]